MTEHIETAPKKPRMLIADDDPAIVKLLAKRCASMGFEVETASNGIQALLKAKRNHPDILVIDVNMPQVDGLSVCTHLLDPAKSACDVVVVTGNSRSETVERCKSLGAFYAHKGPDFWNKLTLALTEIYPDMADQIKDLAIPPGKDKVRDRPRVLVIDDDDYIQAFFSSRLEKYGVEMLYAPNATQGYRIACHEAPSAIVCDYFMPDGDALYILSRLRTTPAARTIPFLVFSGRELDDSIRHSLTREICGWPGATRVLRKSFDTQELFGALQEFCAFGSASLVPAE